MEQPDYIIAVVRDRNGNVADNRTFQNFTEMGQYFEYNGLTEEQYQVMLTFVHITL